MNRISVIVILALLCVSLLLTGASCTKKEKDPDKVTEETTGEVNADTDETARNENDAGGTGTSEGSTNKDTSDTTVKGETVGTSKDESKESEKVDKDSKETSSDKGSKDTEKAPSSASTDSKDTEKTDKTDKETAYQPEPMTYKEFISMTPADQQAYFEKFEDIEDYMKWYNDALDEYEKEQNKQEIDGVIDLGELVNGGN